MELHTHEAPSPVGPYSQAVATSGEFIFVSGQLGMDPESGQLDRGIEAQARRALENIRAILGSYEIDMRQVVKATIYLADIEDFAKVNAVYGGFFDRPYPARAALEVSALPLGALVEIEVIAAAVPRRSGARPGPEVEDQEVGR
jgi:2-iminobutanoate/2-iminopropanoate deaminase